MEMADSEFLRSAGETAWPDVKVNVFGSQGSSKKALSLNLRLSTIQLQTT
jgi:hypothetical protein